jgi:SAM-dependent methyltransferase
METWEEAVLWLRAQPGREDLVKAAYFDDPLVEAAERYHAGAEWQAVKSLLPVQPGMALDLGAGRGIVAYALAHDGWRVTALEPDPSEVVGAGAIRHLGQESGLPIEVVSNWGESLPFERGVFDAILCRQVLHHARDLGAFCREVHRVLKPGGRLYALREHVISRPGDMAAFLDSHPLHHRYGGEKAYLLAEYLEAIRGAGLLVERVMNPFASEINTAPETLQEVRARVAARLHLPLSVLRPRLLSAVGALIGTPGRLYSFVARKSPDA